MHFLGPVLPVLILDRVYRRYSLQRMHLLRTVHRLYYTQNVRGRVLLHVPTGCPEFLIRQRGAKRNEFLQTTKHNNFNLPTPDLNKIL